MAANQAGYDLSIAIMQVPGYEQMDFFNPVITRYKGNIEYEEGCLSIPGQRFVVTRASTIWVSYQDVKGVAKTEKLKGRLAQCLQHEADHLNGITLMDRTKKPYYEEGK